MSWSPSAARCSTVTCSRSPPSTGAIADELVVTQAAVKQHLANLFDKFGIPAGDSHRRARLANEALRRGAVSLTQLRASESEEG